MKILFICSSNVCRSPYCEFMFRRMVQECDATRDKIEVRSAAVVNISREIFPKAVVCLKNEGFEESEILAHKPSFKWCDMSRFREADIIIGMSKAHKFFTPVGCKKKFITLSEAASGKYSPIPDPFLEKSQEKYDDAMRVIKNYLIEYFEKLKNNFTNPNYEV